MSDSKNPTSQLRVLLVGRRFWPLGGFDSAADLKRLATGLSRSDLHVEVATAKFASSWPDQIHMAGCSVHRAASAPKSDWTLSRYTRNLTQWLRMRLDSFDVVLVDSIGEEAIAAIEACRGKACASVLMFNGSEAEGEMLHWQKNRAAKRCAAIGRMADAIMVRNSIDHRYLLAHQYDEKKIHRVATPIPNITRAASVEQLQARKRAARRSLATANSDLATMADTPVVLCHARMNSNSQIEKLVSSVRSLVIANPDLRVWFLGDGPSRDRIHNRLRGDGVRSNIAMPGSFCDLHDVLSAADAYVQPGADSMRHYLPMAVAHDLPLIAADIPILRETLSFGESHVQWFGDDRDSELRRRITTVINNADQSAESAIQLRQQWTRHQSEANQIHRIVDLVESVSPRCRISNARQSAGATG